ncbi:6-bladed beta-propeller [Rhodohalobacter sulfatireducens]|uniref:6-bladed beta-propeller n=1 Tax=Rhodohalobacter sulfatireducens TaxID=2911366 RepID=A0ABS9KBJ8_9BACT|nr:6-bladed beta-propeller [Rhodohalobacter sulfatireducens]MCG2588200.1 6-bladed beta-propeller [Rhodohalobacter sulfatireducens]
MSDINKYSIVFLAVLLFVFVSCSKSDTHQPIDRTPTIDISIDLIIGAEDQPLDYQLGRPIAVRTDEEGNIYIADRASKQIKVFDEEGNHLKNLGGRGRGPGEFQDIELMEITPDGDLVVMDRGLLKYKVISTEGEFVEAWPYNLSKQFYPQGISYMNDEILALFLNSSSAEDIQIFNRDLFHVYTTDFQQKKSSFVPFKDLELKGMFPWILMAYHPGSFKYIMDQNVLVFSPGVYNGSLFMYKKQANGNWEFDKTLRGSPPNVMPYEVFDSEQKYIQAVENQDPKAIKANFRDGIYMGRQLSMDAGLYRLEDGRIVHFYAEWREGYTKSPDSNTHLMDLYVQIFDQDGSLRAHSYLFAYPERHQFAQYSPVNWKDEKDRFYLFASPNDIPTVRRFSLGLSE